LGDPIDIKLEKSESGFKLVISGGRYTASGYEAVLIFESDHIQRRNVRLRIFPDDVWSQTVYSFIGENDER
jgi:hypothetical protein